MVPNGNEGDKNYSCNYVNEGVYWNITNTASYADIHTLWRVVLSTHKKPYRLEFI